jgi:hypothetical protein
MNLEIEPGPDFAERVMAAVRRETNAPGPIPFPWRRIAATAAVAVAVSAISLAAVAKSGAGLEGPLSGIRKATESLPPAHVALGAAAIVLLGAVIGVTARLASR